MSKILVINGPNLNLLGKREKSVYGEKTLKEINKELEKIAVSHNVNIEFFQSNYEGKIIDKIQSTDADFIIINPASLTHTSIGLRDVLLAREIPCIEVHLSNLWNREEFRRKSLVSEICIGVISGFKDLSYKLALLAAIEFLSEKARKNI